MSEVIVVQICLDCFRKAAGNDAVPERSQGLPLEPCADCGETTASGIQVTRQKKIPPDLLRRSFTVIRYEQCQYTAVASENGEYLTIDLDSRSVNDIDDTEIMHRETDVDAHEDDEFPDPCCEEWGEDYSNHDDDCEGRILVEGWRLLECG